MIKGTGVSLRPVAETDLEELHRHALDIAARGPFYPMPQSSLTKWRGSFAADGWWSPDNGTFVIVDANDRLVGLVIWVKLNGSAPDVELGYRVFDPADYGKGIASEALDLLAGWLFDTYSMNRVLLYIHADNVASHRVAEKCGFTKEATAREAWYLRGKWHDLDVFTMTRAESHARRASD